jgi:Tol biopolymer transport system component
VELLRRLEQGLAVAVGGRGVGRDRRRGARAVVVAALAIATAGCKDGAKKPGPGSGTGTGTGTGTGGSVSPGVETLPGAIWYVVEGEPPTTLHRWAGGVSKQLGASLYPSAMRLGDRLVGIRSAGTGEAGGEAAVAIAVDGVVSVLGTPATQVRDPAVDRDGKWIVVAANFEGHSELYAIDPAKPDAMTQITRNPEGNFHPTPLAGGMLAFASSRDGDSEIYRCAIDGTKAQRLTAFHRDDWDPIASPDGGTIAFLSDREGAPRIFLMAPDGTAQRRLTKGTGEREEVAPVWSPDGKTIAYIAQAGADRQLVIHDVAAGTERVATPTGESDADPSFSPDGAWIVVARAIVRGNAQEHELYAVPVAEGPALRITAGGGSEGLPRWTP